MHVHTVSLKQQIWHTVLRLRSFAKQNRCLRLTQSCVTYLFKTMSSHQRHHRSSCSCSYLLA